MQVRAVSVNCTRQLLTFTSKCPRSSGIGIGIGIGSASATASRALALARARARNPFPPNLDSHYRSFFNSRVSLRVLVPFSFDPYTGGEAVDKGVTKGWGIVQESGAFSALPGIAVYA